MRTQEIRSLSLEELEKKLQDAHRELFNLRFRLATKQLINYHEIRNVKKGISRIKTVIREKEISREELMNRGSRG